METTKYNVYLRILVHWKPENSEIGRRNLESSQNFKKSSKRETQPLCSVNRTIRQIRNLEVSRKTICFVATSNTLEYCYNVVFLFHCFLVITVWACLIWKCLVCECLIWECLIWECLIWEFLIWKCLIWECLIWECLIWECLICIAVGWKLIYLHLFILDIRHQLLYILQLYLSF